MNLHRLEVKTDERGSLVEAFKLPNDGQIFYVVAKPNQMRGDHYHKRKTEYFLVIDGSAIMEVRDIKDPTSHSYVLSGDQPEVMKVTPFNYHSITAGSSGCTFLVWADEQFNPNDPDTYKVGEE